MNQKILLLIALIILAGCTLFDSTTVRGNTFTITIQPGGMISQETININAGDTVRWINKDSQPHKIKSALFESPTLNPGDEYQYKFNTPANLTYTYTTGTGSITVN